MYSGINFGRYGKPYGVQKIESGNAKGKKSLVCFTIILTSENPFLYLAALYELECLFSDRYLKPSYTH